MLYEWLLLICLLYLMILPFFVVKLIAYGMKLALAREKEAVPEFIKVPKVRVRKENRQARKQRLEKEAEIKKINAVLSNIDKYDGSDKGQEEIK